MAFIPIRPRMLTSKHIFAACLTVFTILVLLSGFYHDDNANSLDRPQSPGFTTTDVLQDTLDDISQGWHKVSKTAQESAQHIQRELEKIHLGDVNKAIAEIPEHIREAVGKVNITQLEHWLMQETELGLQEALERLQAIDWKDLPAEGVQWVNDHPKETAIYAVETALLFVPGGAWWPVLRVLGFARKGIRARSLAAFIQSKIGARVPARGWFAHLISAAMGGYGKSVLNFWTRVVVKTGTWIHFLAGVLGGRT